MKTLKTLQQDYDGYKPKAGDEQKFKAKHVVKHSHKLSKATEDDDVFKATNVKVSSREPGHGYNAGEDEDVYEEKITHDVKAHTKAWLSGSDAPMDDDMGDYNKMHRLAKSHLSGGKVPAKDHSDLADKMVDHAELGESNAHKALGQANEEKITAKDVKMAIGVAKDKRYAGGNMTGASRVMDKIKPGLSKHPAAQKALRQANEGFGDRVNQQKAHEYNLDAAQREMDRRHAQGEDMTGAKIDKKTYKIVKPKQQGVGEETEQIDELSVNKMLKYTDAANKNREVLNKKWDTGTATEREQNKVLGHEAGVDRAAARVKAKTGKNPNEIGKLSRMKYAITKEEVEQMDEGGMPPSVIKHKQRIKSMSPQEFYQAHKDKSEADLKSMARRHGYGQDNKVYVDKHKKGQQNVSEEVELTLSESKEAKALYHQHHATVMDLLKKVSEGVKQHKAAIESDPTRSKDNAYHYGHVGDMKNYKNQLEDMHQQITQMGEYAKPLMMAKMNEEADPVVKKSLGEMMEAMKNKEPVGVTIHYTHPEKKATSETHFTAKDAHAREKEMAGHGYKVKKRELVYGKEST